MALKPTELSQDQYFVPAKKVRSEVKIKGSRFLCTIVPVADTEKAEYQYAQLKKKYFDATHNCFAWRIDQNIWRYSDDGEPSGTAGKPILQAILAKDLYQILCVVTRYFGGVKLGTGGLIRAYGESAKDGLDQVPLVVKTIWDKIVIQFDFSLENIIRRTLLEFDGQIRNSNYDDKVEMALALPKSEAANFKNKIIEITNFSITFL